MQVLFALPIMVVGLLALRLLLDSRLLRTWHHAEVKAPDKPEPRTPSDASRTYPRPKGSRSRLNRVCPVCGTGRETGDLDRRVLGWPAHRTCAEWLGDWKPAPPPYKPDEALIGYMEKGQKAPDEVSISVSGSPGAQVNVGDRNIQYGSFPVASAEDLAAAQEMVTRGMISVDEVRARILSAFSVPDPAIFAPKGSVTWSAAGDRQPLTRRWRCACGAIGYLEGDLAIHRRWCPMER